MKPSEIYKENADNCAMLAEGELEGQPGLQAVPAHGTGVALIGRRAGMAGRRSATAWDGSRRRIDNAAWLGRLFSETCGDSSCRH